MPQFQVHQSRLQLGGLAKTGQLRTAVAPGTCRVLGLAVRVQGSRRELRETLGYGNLTVHSDPGLIRLLHIQKGVRFIQLNTRKAWVEARDVTQFRKRGVVQLLFQKAVRPARTFVQTRAGYARRHGTDA